MAQAPRMRARAPVFDEHRTQVLYPRGIHDWVIDGGGWLPRYVSYAPGDIKTVAKYALTAALEAWIKGVVGQSGGLMIIRRPIQDAEFVGQDLQTLVCWTQPSPVLRPDRPVYVNGERIRYVHLRQPHLRRSQKQVDFHPLARDPVRSGRQPLLFVLEGSLKADAALSARMAAFSVPGVTMWNSPDLTRVLSYLKNAPVVLVVTDSDWDTNPSVAHQAARCVEWLKEHGIRALHVAPPEVAGRKTGIDDFLAAGGRPDQLLLVPLPPEESPRGLSVRGRDLMDWLLHKRSRAILMKPKTAAEELGVSRRTIRRALRDLERAGVIEIERGKSYPLEDGGWETMPHLVRICVSPPVPLGEAGWTEELLLIPKKGERVTKARRAEWARLCAAEDQSHILIPSPAPPQNMAVKIRDARCPACGDELPPSRTRPRKYCGPRCRKRANRRRRLSDGSAARKP